MHARHSLREYSCETLTKINWTENITNEEVWTIVGRQGCLQFIIENMLGYLLPHGNCMKNIIEEKEQV